MWWWLEALRDILWGLMLDFVMLPYTSGVWLFDQIFAVLPVVNIASEIASTVYWLSLANSWVPVVELFAAFVTLWTFQATFITVKYIAKALPTVG